MERRVSRLTKRRIFALRESPSILDAATKISEEPIVTDQSFRYLRICRVMFDGDFIHPWSNA